MSDRLDLSLIDKPRPCLDADTADALALALFHLHAYSLILNDNPAVAAILGGRTVAEIDAMATLSLDVSRH